MAFQGAGRAPLPWTQPRPGFTAQGLHAPPALAERILFCLIFLIFSQGYIFIDLGERGGERETSARCLRYSLRPGSNPGLGVRPDGELNPPPRGSGRLSHPARPVVCSEGLDFTVIPWDVTLSDVYVHVGSSSLRAAESVPLP